MSSRSEQFSVFSSAEYFSRSDIVNLESAGRGIYLSSSVFVLSESSSDTPFLSEYSYLKFHHKNREQDSGSYQFHSKLRLNPNIRASNFIKENEYTSIEYYLTRMASNRWSNISSSRDSRNRITTVYSRNTNAKHLFVADFDPFIPFEISEFSNLGFPLNENSAVQQLWDVRGPYFRKGYFHNLVSDSSLTYPSIEWDSQGEMKERSFEQLALSLEEYSRFYEDFLKSVYRLYGESPPKLEIELTPQSELKIPSLEPSKGKKYSYENYVASLERDKSTLESTVTQLMNEKDRLEVLLTDNRSNLNKSKQELNRLREQLNITSKNLEERLKRLGELEHTVAQLQAELETRKAKERISNQTRPNETPQDRNFRILGIDRASLSGLTNSEIARVIESAYRVRAIIFHPDRQGGNPQRMREANERMKTINLAYAELKKNFR